MAAWQPGASIEALRARARLLADLRAFFAAQGVLEVETPLLCQAGVTDPHLEPLVVDTGTAPRFLQTSPEYAMKRLLAAGSGDIYQIGKAFRAGEIGRRHNPEYTLLEYYRVGIDHRQLAAEVARLVATLLGRDGWQVWPYRTLFQHLLAIDPHRAALSDLQRVAQAVAGDTPADLDRDTTLDLLMSHAVEPAMAGWGVVIVTDYPASQAALARTTSVSGVEVGCRFECYADGIELANGYWELGDAAELRRRFEADNARRAATGLLERPIDEAMLAAHEAGLPDCAGVALGVDRLLALQLGVSDIRQVLAFDWHRS